MKFDDQTIVAFYFSLLKPKAATIASFLGALPGFLNRPPSYVPSVHSSFFGLSSLLVIAFLSLFVVFGAFP